jgi:NADH-quinone oxidoreductase subunit K
MDKVQFLLLIAVALFALGLLGVIVRRNLLVMLMCMELMLNGVNLSLVTFAQQTGTVAGAVLPLVLLGSLVWLVAIASPLPEGRVNELLLVFVPYDVVLPFLREAVRRQYARARIALLAAVSLFAAVGVFHQPLWAPILVVFAPMAVLAFLPVRSEETERTAHGA